MNEETIGRRDAQIGFRIRSDLKAEIERLARADGRSLANYIERLLDAHVETMKGGEKDGLGVRLRGAKAKR
jgi:predicted HicB family RNase H-like nuclease